MIKPVVDPLLTLRACAKPGKRQVAESDAYTVSQIVLRAVPCLVRLLETPREDIREQAALSIWQLCLVDDTIKLAAAGEGAIGLLMQLLQNGTQASRESAASALACLLPYLMTSHRVGVQLTPEAAGHLVRVVGAATSAGEQATLRVVRLIHSIDTNRTALILGGAVPVLVRGITATAAGRERERPASHGTVLVLS